MKCETCKTDFSGNFCASCGDEFISCNCTSNICLDCREMIYGNPVKYKFGIAYFSLLYALHNLSGLNITRPEKIIKRKLITLIKEVAKEL